MNRYEILLGKKPPPQKKKEKRWVPLSDIHKEFIVGGRRSGKTTTLLNNLIQESGASANDPYLLLVPPTQRHTIKSYLGSFVSYGVLKTWNSRSCVDFSRILSRTLIKHLYLDNVDLKTFYRIVGDVQYRGIKRIVATVDRDDFYIQICQVDPTSSIIFNPRFCGEVQYMGLTWKVTLPEAGYGGLPYIVSL